MWSTRKKWMGRDDSYWQGACVHIAINPVVLGESWQVSGFTAWSSTRRLLCLKWKMTFWKEKSDNGSAEYSERKTPKMGTLWKRWMQNGGSFSKASKLGEKIFIVNLPDNSRKLCPHFANYPLQMYLRKLTDNCTSRTMSTRTLAQKQISWHLRLNIKVHPNEKTDHPQQL